MVDLTAEDVVLQYKGQTLPDQYTVGGVGLTHDATILLLDTDKAPLSGSEFVAPTQSHEEAKATRPKT
jgi:hypothetical protein